MSAALAATLPALTEEHFVQQILDLAQLYGWLAFRVEQSTRVAVRRSGVSVRVRNINRAGVGYPDITLVRAPRLIFAECKRNTGPHGGDSHSRLTREQEVWAHELRQVGLAAPNVEWHFWRPADLDDIARTLAR